MKKIVLIFLAAMNPVYASAFLNPIIPSNTDYTISWFFLFFNLAFFIFSIPVLFLSIKKGKFYRGKLNYLLAFILLVIFSLLILLNIRSYKLKMLIKDCKSNCEKNNQEMCLCNPLGR